MRKLGFIAILAMLFAMPLFAQTGAVQGHSYLGGTKAQVSGIGSTNYLDGIIPSATITVYLTGTTTKATIYADKLSTPLANPFTSHTVSSVDPGGWIFWAATNQGLDVVMSGGIAPNTYPQPVTLVDIFPSSQFISPGGGCGTVSGDNTSTNCGYQNRVGDTAAVPANVTSYGSNGLLNNSGQHIVAIGETPLSNGNGGSNIVSIGNHPTDFGSGSDTIDIGDNNFGSSSGSNLVTLGAANNLRLGAANDLIAIGDDNIDGTASRTSSWSNSVLLGNNVGENNDSGLTPIQHDVIAIGDFAYKNVAGNDNIAIGDNAFTESTGFNNDQENVIIGSFAGSAIVRSGTSSFESNVAIGEGPMVGATSAVNNSVGIGTSALQRACAANNIGIGVDANSFTSGQYNLAIGFDAMYHALATSTCIASHTNSVAVGNYALAALTTGNFNVAVGDYAGADGYNPGITDGNSNLTGANNTWIGYDSGPNTTTQLTNTVAIGYQAHNTASNQVVLGNPSITQTVLYGVTVHGTIFSAAGTALPSCVAGLNGATAIVSDATAPTYLANYSSGGTVVSPVMCNGTNWVTY